jgi:serine/threonine-protein kinase
MSASAPGSKQSDYNLLFGALALQMDFITKDALVTAMGAWVMDKKQPLGQILVDQCVLTPARQALLEALVGEHLAQHAGNVTKSLAALPVLEATRFALNQVDDIDLHTTLSGLADPYATASAPDPTVTDGARFRILRPHARGGLGEVFVALDQELHREVALKEIQTEHASYILHRQRFLQEAEITGGLEHPGIVPVYALGQYADGRPYYAMRFIQGESLKEALTQFHQGKEGYTLRGLLTRFIAVCNAIAYAHSRGVIHRDVKPSNIMLGKFGETLVVDWGLAKAVGKSIEETKLVGQDDEPTLIPRSGDSSAQTQAGEALGTPAYMSPEQAAGRIDDLGPSTDVYSLGATLYHVLAGSAPFTGRDSGEVLRQVQIGAWQAPRLVKKGTAPGLDAICQKAMALQPTERYSSALELAAEVEAWLADEPVHAYPEPLPERAARWARKHRAASVAGGAALAVTAAAAVIVAVLVNFSRTEIKKQRDAADTNYARAEENFQLAHQAVQDYLTRVSENKLLKTQDRLDLRELRKELLEDALRYYQKFIEQRGEDPQQRADLADAYEKVADITKEIGSKTDALRRAQQALGLREEVALAEPEDAEAQQRLASTYFVVGALQRDTGDLDAALSSFHRARDIYETLAADHLENLNYRRQYALAFNRIAIVSHDSSKPREALLAYQKALEIMEQLVKERPKEIPSLNLLGTIINNIGLVQQQLGEEKKALSSYERAVCIFDSLANLQPDDPNWRNVLAAAHNDVGCLAADLGDRTEGLRRLNKALDLHLEVVRLHPTVLAFQDDLARTYMNIADLKRKAGEPLDALQFMQKCLDIRTKLARDNPKVFWFQNQWAATYLNIGLAQADASNLGGAASSYQQAITIEIPLVESNPDKPKLASTLGRTYYRLGLVRLKQSRRPEALAALTMAIEQHRKAFDKSSQVAEFREFLSDDYHALADLHRESNQNMEALGALRACRSLWADNAAELYRIAAGMARCGGLDDAVAILAEAIHAGFRNLDVLRTDASFEKLREREDFKKLLGELELKK